MDFDRINVAALAAQDLDPGDGFDLLVSGHVLEDLWGEKTHHETSELEMRRS